jgi:hypothetical protein
MVPCVTAVAPPREQDCLARTLADPWAPVTRLAEVSRRDLRRRRRCCCHDTDENAPCGMLVLD